ncbi:MAG: response regulator transcription factor [Verrucomicrobiota bacterium]
MASKPFTVALIEDHQILAELMGKWINLQPDFRLVGCAADGEAGLQLCLRLQPHLVLLDIELPKLDGLQLALTLLEQLPQTRLLVMSGLVDPHTVWRVIRSGVHGYIEKTQSPPELLQTMQTVSQGGTYFSPGFMKVKEEWLSRPDAFQKILSAREQEVIKHMFKGWDDETIGQTMEITPATVAMHRKNLREKLSLHSDRDLMGYARRWGLDVANKQRT